MKLLPFLLLAFGSSASASVELHAHLFMNEGMTWAFNGGFDGPLKARDWNDKLSSQANAESVNRSGITILVVSLYANPLFTLDMRDSIRRQIAQTKAFARANPEWTIARTPDEARDARAKGKRVLLFALEGADGMIETEADLEEFVDREGVRIVTLLHLTDDDLGGVAFLKGYKALASPFAFLEHLFDPVFDPDGVRLNRNGLTERGRELTASLIRHQAWIDLAHASDASQRALFPILAEAGQPLLYTHTTLRKHHRAERGISGAQLEEVARSRGVIGLMPATEMLEGTPGTQDCPAGVGPLVTQYLEVASKLGAPAVALGSDYNGAIAHLPPGCRTGTSLDDEGGLWNIGQSADVWKAIGKLGGGPASAAETEGAFLDAWSRAFFRNRV